MKIGFIGLGIMGKPMSRNLLKAGFELIVYDIDETAVKIIEKAGAKPASSPKEVAQNSDVIITMLPKASIVKSVLEDENGILAGIKENSVVIDMSSVSPVASKEFAQLVEAKKCKFLDAPVSGGEIGAVNATMAIMIGGDEAVVERVRPILEALGKSITVVGPNGSGSVAKLANQIMVNLNIAAVAEALVLATKAGADPKKVFEAVRGGFADSAVLEEKAPMMYSRNFKAGGPIYINLKDITNVVATADELDVPLILTPQLKEIMISLKATGHNNDDHSSIVQFYEKIAGVTVKAK
ncbi:2-hydroxy-3-oxopropionate reductase [Megamonas hypermegale]|uniref:2-hydroxy-3-oxopropionate reductase n=1 Tax=Megamonas hypermegale TaxID=158847 RepID=UPI0025A380F4|nr:2-hydroxy-3-oxopropionate reductase [Megamonas hypermegale]MDM8143816.1 2-hydroxy-3-oxopropionate reductase [Megamonas hypermegale]